VLRGEIMESKEFPAKEVEQVLKEIQDYATDGYILQRIDKLRPLVTGDGTVEERHETDRQMDGVVQTKCLTVQFDRWRDIPGNFWKKITGKG
jgi:hypothetical protein